MTGSLRNLAASIDSTYELYHQMLWLVVEVQRYALQRIELARNKRLPTKEDLNPNRRFVDNRAVAQIASAKPLTDRLSARKLGWSDRPELIKSLYNSLAASDFFLRHMEMAECCYKDDVRLAEDFYIEIADRSEALEEAVEEQSILWADDMDFSILMVLRTLSLCRAGQELPIVQQFKNDDDRRFAGELFRGALVNYDAYMKYVERFTQNWDVERIAFVDGLTIVTAIAELIHFPTIPVKVTFDEYIEISKYYSTPGSSTFINGLLDKIVEELRAESLIRKEGRGLM
jgi:N utilization substance protein B